MRIFLAGATGVAGRALVPLLVADGHQVSGVGRTPEKRAALTAAGAVPVAVDLFSAGDVRAAVAGHEVVINLATHIPSTSRMVLPGAWGETARLRSEASVNLVNAALAAGAQRYIQESLALAYPDRGAEWIDESTPLDLPKHVRSVGDAEAAAQRFAAGGTGVILRFAAFYGPESGQTRATLAAVRRGIAAMPGPPEGYVSSIAIVDAAAAVVAALQLDAGVYNVADEPLTRQQFHEAIAAALGVRPPRSLPFTKALLGPAGGMLARSLRVSSRKLRQASGWTPRYPSAREGWRAVVEQLGDAA